jgi:Na+/H+ antiporter NhaC
MDARAGFKTQSASICYCIALFVISVIIILTINYNYNDKNHTVEQQSTQVYSHILMIFTLFIIKVIFCTSSGCFK